MISFHFDAETCFLKKQIFPIDFKIKQKSGFTPKINTFTVRIQGQFLCIFLYFGRMTLSLLGGEMF